MSHVHRFVAGALLIGGIMGTGAVIQSQRRGPAGEWRYFGGDHAFTRYSSLDQINKASQRAAALVQQILMFSSAREEERSEQYKGQECLSHTRS